MGILSTHRYFEEISQIETRRYVLKGVEVFQEDFGSDDHQIAYSFTAKELIVKGIDENNESLFSYEEIKKIESELYSDEDINKRGEKDGRDQGTDRSDDSRTAE
jgi:hypothetical protein